MDGRETGGRRKAVVAGSIGNFVEWFDFTVYGFVAGALATNFFPSEDRVASLLATFAVLAVAFVARPIGGVVFGHFGDKVGRRSTLAVVVLLMSLATAAIGVLPTYAAIGVWAPILLFACRLLQGLSAGGEYAGAVSYVVEYAPAGRRGLFGSLVQTSAYAGIVSAALVGLLLAAAIPAEAMNAWGWRLPFLLAAPLGLVGLYLRLRLEDTPAFRAVERAEAVEPAPVVEAVRGYLGPVALLFVGYAVAGVVIYTLIAYMPTYLQETVGLDPTTALLTNAAALGLLTVACPIFGVVSDRVGRKPVLVSGLIGFAILGVPSFLLLEQGSLMTALLGQGILAVLQAAIAVTLAVIPVELLPTKVRYSGTGISYNLAYMAFGGTAPFVATFLVARTGSDISPAIYAVAFAVAALLVVLFALKETRATGPLESQEAPPLDASARGRSRTEAS